jgi:hypothetical protein
MRREAGALVILRENEERERADCVRGGEGSTSMLFERDERPVMKLRVWHHTSRSRVASKVN